MSTQTVEQHFRAAIWSTVSLARASGLPDDVICGYLRSTTATVSREWKAETERRNAERINGERPMNA